MRRFAAAAAVATLVALSAFAHVQVMVVTEETVGGQKGAVRDIDIRFVEHAMQDGPLLLMEKPKVFGVLVNGQKRDLLDALQAKSEGDKTVYTCSYTIQEPGAHALYLEPTPYWDAGEEVMVVHHTKVLFNSCGAGLKTESAMGWENWEGWDARVGFPVEIDPLVQLTSLWTNSVFRGVVRDAKGQPIPSCRIEVEYYNKGKAVAVPNASFLTQILKTDEQGVFAFTPVRAGWWALTALPGTDLQMKNPEGKKVAAEVGGVLWIHAADMEAQDSRQ